MEFLNNEDVKQLFVYLKSPLIMLACRTCEIGENTEKGLFFLKISNNSKLTYEHMSKHFFLIMCENKCLSEI